MKNSSDNRDIYKSLFHHLRSGVAVYNAENNGQDVILIDGNKALEDICNVKKEGVIGKNVCDVFPGIVSTRLFDVIKQVYKDGYAINHPTTHYQDHTISF